MSEAVKTEPAFGLTPDQWEFKNGSNERAKTKLQEHEAQAILDARGDGRAEELAKQYGISQQLVRFIWAGERWGHLTTTAPKRKHKKAKPRNTRHAWGQLKRVLLLVDTLAPLRRYYSTNEITAMMRERTGSAISKENIYNDLRLLVSLHMAETKIPGGRGGGRPRVWRLHLRSTESIQAAAVEMFD